MAIKYVVNEEKKTVVAIIEANPYVLSHKLRGMGTEIDIMYGNGKYINLKVEDTYVGVAKLNPQDTWDVEVGKSVARNKAFKKYYKDCKRKLDEVLNSQALKSTKKLREYFKNKVNSIEEVLSKQ